MEMYVGWYVLKAVKNLDEVETTGKTVFESRQGKQVKGCNGSQISGQIVWILIIRGLLQDHNFISAK